MAKIILIEGPVGAGKTRFALQLMAKNNAVRFALDEWMATLFSPDRPSLPERIPEWYLQRKQRCLDLIWNMSSEILDSGNDVLLELGLIRRIDREAFFERIQSYQVQLFVLDAPRSVRRERVKNRNMERGATFAMDVPDAMFEFANSLWEPLDDTEYAFIEGNHWTVQTIDHAG